MRNTLVTLVAAAACVFTSRAALGDPITHYLVGGDQMQSGPLEILDSSHADFDSVTNEWTFFGEIRNNSGQTYHDVLILLQFVLDDISPLVFDDDTNTWSGNGHFMYFDTPGEFPVANTDAPLVYSKDGLDATLAPTDTVPFLSVGDILPGETVFGTFVGHVDSEWEFDLPVGLLSTDPLPEPSALALLAIGGIGAMVIMRRRVARR